MTVAAWPAHLSIIPKQLSLDMEEAQVRGGDIKQDSQAWGDGDIVPQRRQPGVWPGGGSGPALGVGEGEVGRHSCPALARNPHADAEVSWRGLHTRFVSDRKKRLLKVLQEQNDAEVHPAEEDASMT